MSFMKQTATLAALRQPLFSWMGSQPMTLPELSPPIYLDLPRPAREVILSRRRRGYLDAASQPEPSNGFPPLNHLLIHHPASECCQAIQPMPSQDQTHPQSVIQPQNAHAQRLSQAENPERGEVIAQSESQSQNHNRSLQPIEDENPDQ
jgi:hypothetical protein